MLANIRLIFKKLSKNLALIVVKIINKLTFCNDNNEEKVSAGDWQRIGDDLRKEIVKASPFYSNENMNVLKTRYEEYKKGTSISHHKLLEDD